MTRLLFREDAYISQAHGKVAALTAEGAIVLDQTIFYPTSGGQPGDSGHLSWAGGTVQIATTVKIEGGGVGLVPASPFQLPAVGTAVLQVLDWGRRHLHMRTHTALHLLSVVIPLPVTGGQIGPGRGRLDFDMPEAPQTTIPLQEALNQLIDLDVSVTDGWISDEELAANPGLVKTMSVHPPIGQGRVRLVRIGSAEKPIDLQPCGGTHVARTAEIGRVEIGKIEKKGRQNRRVYISLV